MKFSDWVRMRVGLLRHPQFHKNPAVAIGRRLMWKLYAQHQPLLKFRTEYGFELEGQPQDIGVGSLFYRGQYEWGELQLWRQLLERKNLVIFDVGANVGLYSLLSAAHCREQGLVGAQIFGFEPNPVECAKFQRNVDLNGYSEIKILPLAISDREGVCRMAIPPAGLGVFGHLLANNDSIASRDEVREVKTIDLDNWCKLHGIEQVDLMKLDVEGHELDVLHGAESLLARQAIHILLMEVGHGRWRESLDKLHHYDYSIHLIERDGSLRPFEEEKLTGWSNIIAKPKSLL